MVYPNSKQPYIENLFFDLEKFASAWCLPLMIQDKFSGLLVLYHLTPERKYTKTEVGLVQTFLNQAAAGFQLVELHQSVASQLHQFERLQEISEKVNSIQEDSLADLTAQLSKYACDLLHADCTIIYPYDDELKGFEIKHIGSQGLQKNHFFRAKLRNTPGNLTYQVMQSRKLAIIDDVEYGWDRHNQFKIRGSLEKKGLITSEAIKSFICCGLYSSLEPIGAIFVNFRSKHWFTDDEQEIIKIFSNQISTAIQQTRQRQRASQNLAVIQANQVITRRLGKMRAGQQVWKSVLQNAIKIFITRNEDGWFWSTR